MQRAFTLLEVLVVVLLVVLIASIVGPIALSEIGRTSLEEAHRQVDAAAMLTRADAQRRGAVVELWMRSGEEGSANGAEVFAVELMGPEVDAQRKIVGADDEGSDEGQGFGEERVGSPRAARKERLIAALPSGVWAGQRLPARFTGEEDKELLNPTAGNVDLDAQADFRERAGARSEERRFSLCVFFPDGQVVPGGTCYLYAKQGKAWSILVNRWTGAVIATPIAPKEARAGSEENDPEAPASPDPPAASNRTEGQP